jgi:Holliday junction resolvasome RuvABC endonuclease subunit
MNFMGIDPGQSGGIAIYLNNELSVCRMPPTEKDISQVFADLAASIDFAYIEAVHSMPKQGVASSFKFGRSYGFLRGMLIAHGIPFEEVSPQKWQKAMACMSHGDKNVTKKKAQQLFPLTKITHATADALLILEYCRRTCGRSEPDWNDL